MQQAFVPFSNLANEPIKSGVSASHRAQLVDYAPWVATIIRVDGGYRLFESRDDAATWRRQR